MSPTLSDKRKGGSANTISAGATGCALVFMLTFALAFSAAAGLMGWFLVGDLGDALAMRGWVPVPMQIESAALREHADSDDGTTWEATARYRYDFEDGVRVGTRVGVHHGADNLGDYQQRMYALLVEHRDSGVPLTGFVDPRDPDRAVLDRSLRVSRTLLYAAIFLTFGGIGLGMLAAVLSGIAAMSDRRSRRRRDPDAPWLWRADWARGCIRDAAPGWAVFLVSLALPWLLVAGLMTFLALGSRPGPGALDWLLLGLFMLAGVAVGLIGLRRLARHRRLGGGLLRLARVPLTLGAPMEGVVEVAPGVDPDGGFLAVLRCIESRTQGSGDDAETVERTLTQARSKIPRAALRRDPGRLLVPIGITVPANGAESSSDPNAEPCVTWKLELAARLGGGEYQAAFEVPVFHGTAAPPPEAR